jgi:hypothetical protein
VSSVGRSWVCRAGDPGVGHLLMGDGCKAVFSFVTFSWLHVC